MAESDRLNRQIINIGEQSRDHYSATGNNVHRLCGVPWPLRLEMVPYDQIAARRYEDVRRRMPDIEKAKRQLHFEAQDHARRRAREPPSRGRDP